MATYLELTNAMLSDGKPLTTAIAMRFRDNPIALYENTIHAAILGSNDDCGASPTYADVEGFNISAPANSVWRIHYAIKATIDVTSVIYAKVYAASLAATPGYHSWLTEDTGATWLAAAAVDSNCLMLSNTGAVGTAFGKALVFVGNSDTTIKLATTADEDARINQDSFVLAQEISGST